MNRIGDELYRVGLVLLLLLMAGMPSAAASGTRIVVYGATGAIGSLITQEALRRGDTVVGVARDPTKLKISDPHYTAVAGDVTNLDSFKSITQGADAVIISVLDSGKNAPENSVSAQAAKVAVEAYTGVSRSPHIIDIGAAPTMMYESQRSDTRACAPSARESHVWHHSWASGRLGDISREPHPLDGAHTAVAYSGMDAGAHRLNRIARASTASRPPNL